MAGKISAKMTAMIASTTRNSINVNASTGSHGKQP